MSLTSCLRAAALLVMAGAFLVLPAVAGDQPTMPDGTLRDFLVWLGGPGDVAVKFGVLLCATLLGALWIWTRRPREGGGQTAFGEALAAHTEALRSVTSALSEASTIQVAQVDQLRQLADDVRALTTEVRTLATASAQHTGRQPVAA